MNARRATISDVARTAGVSPSTASVVFSGKTPVSEATRSRVLDAAASLGYSGPDPRAASLRRGRSGIVGVVLQGRLGAVFRDPVLRLTMDGLSDAVAPLGADLLLLHDEGKGSGAPTLLTAPIDAAVLVGCSGLLREQLATVRSRGIPVVVIEGDAGADVPRVGLDNRDAQRVAAAHVADLGHRNVFTLTLPTHWGARSGWITPEIEAAITVEVTRDRLAGFRDQFPTSPAYAAAESSIDEGLRAGRLFFADADLRPTAVVAQSDLLATGVIRAAEEAGLRVPEDVSVTGFDGIDVDGLAPYVLTTQVQAATLKGRIAGEAIAALLSGDTPHSHELTCTFRVGNTSAIAPAASPAA